MEGPQVELSDIQRFYKDATVFLTGCTGFVGKLFLEKILRSLPIKKVFILVRNKEKAPTSKRMEDLFESIVFNGIKRTNPEVLTKVVLMEGDCSLPMLGLSQENVNTIINEVNVIIHCAAIVKFDEQLKIATRTNVRSVRDLVDIANRIKKLKTFIYVGTAYSNSNLREIKEEIYPAKIKAEDLIAVCESLDDDTVEIMTKSVVGAWPNTYTFTKQVAEDYINRKGKGLPICIARPAIVISTYKEPVSSFVDNVFTLAGLAIINGLGITQISYFQSNVCLDLIPADFVINECIAAGWNTGETFQKQSEIPVYNIGSVQDNPITQSEVFALCRRYGDTIPSIKTVAYPIKFVTACRYNYLVVRFFLHTLVAIIVDQVVRLKGGKPTCSKDIKRLHQFQEAYEHFTTNSFFLHVENTHKLLRKMTFMDRELFNFDITCVNWDNYFLQYVKGLRVYLLKDPMETLPEGRKRISYLRNWFIVSLITTIVVLYVVGKIVLFKLLPFVFGVGTLFLGKLVC